MASVYTTNVALEEPANGDLVGSWDTAVNGNMSAIDLALGKAQSIGLAAGSVTLSTAQTRSAVLIFTGALAGNVAVTIPGLSTSPGTVVSGRFYTVQNQCSNSSAFFVTLQTTVAGSQAIGLPPMEATDVYLEGTGGVNVGSIKFRNLGRVGTFWDYNGSSVPNWVSACTIPPYLLCDGSAFSSAVYPALAVVVNGTNVPDARGRARFSLNGGTGRVTAGISGINGNTLNSAGGDESMQSHNHGVTDPGHHHTPGGGVATTFITNNSSTLTFSAGNTGGPLGQIGLTSSDATGITINSNGSGGSQNMPPAYIGGITMIRAA